MLDKIGLSMTLRTVYSMSNHQKSLINEDKLDESLNKYNKDKKINPWYITGFTDAEGSFIVSFLNKKNNKTGCNVIPFFTIQLHIRDILILQSIKSFFALAQWLRSCPN